MVENNPAPSDCPDLENLAAFVDGELSGQERDAVVAHLADCEACYEIYSETLRVQEDLEPRIAAVEEDEPEEVELAPVVVHPRSRAWIWKVGASLAAAAMLAFAVTTWWSTQTEWFRPVSDISTMASIRDLPEDWAVHDWPRKRGPASEPSASERDIRRRSFRMGVHVFDLETSLWMEDWASATRQTHQIEILVKEIELSQLWVRQIKDLRQRIKDRAPQAELLDSRSELEEDWTGGEYPMVDRFFYFFGQWTEVGRLAMLTDRPEFLEHRDFRRFLRRLRKQDLPERVAVEVEKIDGLIETGVSEELGKAFEEIIRREGIR